MVGDGEVKGVGSSSPFPRRALFYFFGGKARRGGRMRQSSFSQVSSHSVEWCDVFFLRISCAMLKRPKSIDTFSYASPILSKVHSRTSFDLFQNLFEG